MKIRAFEQRDYQECLTQMRDFTAGRDRHTPDEIWLVEHAPVFTLGLAAKAEHLLDTGNIPVVKTERGGQVTYHGPGQVVAYLLVDIARRGLGIKEMVNRIEQSTIDLLGNYGIDAQRRAGAPGVFVHRPRAHQGSKIAALGLKVSRGRTFHGMALNVAMDLSPFSRINPCGYEGMVVTDMQTLAGPQDTETIANQLSASLVATLGAPATSKPENRPTR